MPEAYVIGRIAIHDRAWTKEYGARAPAIIARHGGRYLSRGSALTQLEGIGSGDLSGIVLLAFPSREDALAWYNDPEYAELVRLRQTGAVLDLTVIEATS